MQKWLIELFLNWQIFNVLRDEDSKQEKEEDSRYETSSRYANIQIWLNELFLIWSISHVSRDEDSEQEQDEEEDTIRYNQSDFIHWLFTTFISLATLRMQRVGMTRRKFNLLVSSDMLNRILLLNIAILFNQFKSTLFSHFDMKYSVGMSGWPVWTLQLGNNLGCVVFKLIFAIQGRPVWYRGGGRYQV